MLVLSRKLHESIVIGEDIIVTVVEIEQGKIRLGITAPKDIPVHRKEIWLKIEEQRIANLPIQTQGETI